MSVMDESARVAAVTANVAHAVPVPFDDFFTQHRDRLFGAMCLVTHDRSEAEDIAQEAFVRVLERWERVSALDDPEGYLYRTAMNAFRKRYRRASLAARRTLRVAPQEDPIDVVDSHDTAVRALATLSERQRAAIVLTDLLGFSSEEAAQMLGIGPSTVRADASIARAALRQTFSEER